MNAERDELADLIDDSMGQWCDDERLQASTPRPALLSADAILAAGYRKPRVIATDEELDDLPEGTAIFDQCERLTFEETSLGCLEWVDRHGNACWVQLPATVIHEGAAS